MICNSKCSKFLTPLYQPINLLPHSAPYMRSMRLPVSSMNLTFTVAFTLQSASQSCLQRLPFTSLFCSIERRSTISKNKSMTKQSSSSLTTTSTLDRQVALMMLSKKAPSKPSSSPILMRERNLRKI